MVARSDALTEASPTALEAAGERAVSIDFYDFESSLEIGRTTFLCPAELPAPVAERAASLAIDVHSSSAAPASPAST